MTALATAAVFAWVVLGVVLFRRSPGHRTVIGVYVVGFLVLPEFGSSEFIEGVPRPPALPGIQLTKANAIALGLVLGSLLFDRPRWLAARPRWFDLPAIAWCLGPVVTSVANAVVYDDPVARSPDAGGLLLSWLAGSDLHDGLVRGLDATLTWGAPYCLGRLYLTDAGKLREAVVWVAAGAAAYAPLCVLEILISPQLHNWVYGFHQHAFFQTIRLGGYRPVVFLEHGLALGFWMTAGTLAAFWLWLAGPLHTVRLPGGASVSGLCLVVPLAAVTVACKSTGALALAVMGLAVLGVARATRSPVPVLLLLGIPLLYVGARTAGVWDAQEIVTLTERTVGEDRAASFEFRLWNEEMLVEKALQRPLVGWGGWGRSLVHDARGKPLTIADGLWVVTIGERGLIGLVTLGFVMLLPAARALVRCGRRAWADPAWAAVAAAAVILALYAIDCLMNGMVNPVFLLLAGGLVALDPARTEPTVPQPRATAWRVRPAAVRPPSRVARLAGGH